MGCYCTDMGIMVSVGFVFGVILTLVCGIINFCLTGVLLSECFDMPEPIAGLVSVLLVAGTGYGVYLLTTYWQ